MPPGTFSREAPHLCTDLCSRPGGGVPPSRSGRPAAAIFTLGGPAPPRQPGPRRKSSRTAAGTQAVPHQARRASIMDKLRGRAGGSRWGARRRHRDVPAGRALRDRYRPCAARRGSGRRDPATGRSVPDVDGGVTLFDGPAPVVFYRRAAAVRAGRWPGAADDREILDDHRTRSSRHGSHHRHATERAERAVPACRARESSVAGELVGTPGQRS